MEFGWPIGAPLVLTYVVVGFLSLATLAGVALRVYNEIKQF